MKFTPESQLKMARIVHAAAKAASGTKKRRLESLACAHQIAAKQLEAKMKGTITDAPNEIATSNVPLMTHWENPPLPFATLATWEQYLTELRSLPDSVSTRLSIQSAEEMVATKRAEET